jgi:hypothetical protein|nr:hypothetical protein [uncultured Oscillibacter sp.]
MNAKKNAVLKYSNYTTALTRSLKITERLHCRVNEETRAVYVCNGYFLVKLDRTEYDALVRPVTQREAGNFVIENGEQVPNEPLDMEKLLADAAQEAAHELTPAPFLFDPGVKGVKSKIAAYYSESGDFVAGFNSDYAAIIAPSLPRKSKNPTSPMVVFRGDEPQAMILPVRLGSPEKPSRVPAAVRAFFTDKPEESADEKLKRARKDRDEWEQMARRLEAERVGLERTISDLQKVLADKTAEIEALTDRLNAQPDPQPQEEAAEAQQEQTPADKAAALVETLAALDGITATVKGAQTAAPVVWLTGEADAHKEKIEAMGGKWSNKRGAWYFKIA